MKYVIIFFIISILFRMMIAFIVPQPFINDQRDYDYFASKIMADPHFLGSHSFRTYPYPLLIAVLYKFVGFANHQSVIWLQIVMDSVTVILVFLILKLSVKSPLTAKIGLALYALNPFTSGYTNVVLAEIMTTFFIALTVLFGILLIKKPRWYYALLFGICAGIGAETRNAAFLWTAIPIGLFVFFLSLKKYSILYISIIFGVILTVLYPMYTNWRDFNQMSFTTVDSFYAKELFNGAIIKILPPLGPPLPQETYVMYYEYYSEYFKERDTKYRKEIAQKYINKAFDIIKADPIDYLKVRVFKMWYVWQKEAIYTYVEPHFETTKKFVFALNQLLLILSSLGVLIAFRKRSHLNKQSKWLFGTIVGTFFYGTFVFSVTHAEHRLTIPFYPLLIVSAAYTIANIKQFLAMKITQRES